MRDKLVGGELDIAQSLYGLVYGVHLGIGGAAQDMAVLMTLNRNGQGLSLARTLAEQGAVDLAIAGRADAPRAAQLRFAQTFPTGTHAMWLYYWLARAGIHPLRDVRAIVVPPPQMVAHVRDGASTASPSASPGTIAASSTASRCTRRHRRTSGPTTRRRCWPHGATLRVTRTPRAP